MHVHFRNSFKTLLNTGKAVFVVSTNNSLNYSKLFSSKFRLIDWLSRKAAEQNQRDRTCITDVVYLWQHF